MLKNVKVLATTHYNSIIFYVCTTISDRSRALFILYNSAVNDTDRSISPEKVILTHQYHFYSKSQNSLQRHLRRKPRI